MGRGTEKLEEQLAQALPHARILRIDADSTRRKGELENQLAQVHAGDIDILVGTQMIAKGHDFRRITLVAATDPDAALFSSDFRAKERMFALLMQAAGRAGRNAEQSGRSDMLIQTWKPTHPFYQALLVHDYENFAQDTLQEREDTGMPPFHFLALLRAEAKTQETAWQWLMHAQQLAGNIPAGVTVYPPVPMYLSKLADVERCQMLVECDSRPRLQAFLAQWLPALHDIVKSHKGLLRWAIDVDPQMI